MGTKNQRGEGSNNKIIVLEGLPASGKTSLANLLRDKHGFIKVNESLGYLRKESLTETQKDVFDETVEKYKRATMSKRNAIIDRGYPSLLSWDHCAEKLGYAYNLIEKNKWVRDALQLGSLYEPDLYIYLRITPEISLNHRPRVEDKNDVWSGYFGMKHCLDFYESFFSTTMLNKKIIDGSSSIEDMERRIVEIIYDW